MPTRGQSSRAFTTPSPGEILKRSHHRPSVAIQPLDVKSEKSGGFCSDVFQPDLNRDARMERGVVLAPLLVEWHYKITDARRFSKWLKTKDLLLSDARLSINENTSGAHYFGTYIEAQSTDVADGSVADQPVDCQTVWGFSSEDSMNHMFDLCRGKVERTSIVENDLLDFVIGLKTHVREAGSHHFSQRVLAAAAAM